MRNGIVFRNYYYNEGPGGKRREGREREEDSTERREFGEKTCMIWNDSYEFLGSVCEVDGGEECEECSCCQGVSPGQRFYEGTRKRKEEEEKKGRNG